MSRCFVAGVFLCLAASVVSRGDVTLRYSYELKPSPSLPPQAVSAMGAQMKQMMEVGVQIQLKGNKAISNSMGIVSISDFDGEMISLLNPKQAQYATVLKNEYVKAITTRNEAQMSKIPDTARRAMDDMSVNVKSETTGRTLTIQGLEAEERKVTLTMGMPNTPGPMRLVMSCWAPKEDEMISNPMLKELRLFTQRAYQGTDPTAAAHKMFGETPGLGSMSKLMDVFKDMPVILRMNMAMFMPETVAKTLGIGDAPMLEMTLEAKELSAAPVPDSVFDIPRDYSVVTIGEVLTGIYAQMSLKPVAPTNP